MDVSCTMEDEMIIGLCIIDQFFQRTDLRDGRW